MKLFARPAAHAVAMLTSALAHAAPADTAPVSPLPPERNLCSEPAAPLALGSAQWNGWGRDVENTRYQPEPALRAEDVPKLALKWAFGYQGSAVAGEPTVVDGRLFVLSSVGRVYSLDARTGCTYWTFDAAAGARTAISIGELGISRRAAAPPPAPSPRAKKHSRGDASSSSKKKSHTLTLAHLDVLKAPSAAFFGDDSGAVYALDAQRGVLLWKTQVDSNALARIVGAPTIHHGRLYVAVTSSEENIVAASSNRCCSSRGSVAALDMATGNVLWKTYTVGTAASPAGGLADGQIRWVKQFSRHATAGAGGFTTSPILRSLADGKQVILAAQQSGIVYALDPEHGGDLLWQSKVGDPNIAAGVEWGAAADHRRVYIALSGLVAEPDNPSGAMAALDMKTGAQRWYTPAPNVACTWGSESCVHALAQAVTVVPGIAFAGSMDGHLRAYSTIDGKVVWDVNTAQDFLTLNGVKASGGSLDQGGAAIVNGVLYINSGYGQRAGQPGNVLLAFSVEGK